MAGTGRWIHLHTVDSTNEYLKRNGEELPDWTLVTASHQTAGKGRQGKVWQDCEAQSFLGSWLLKGLSEEQLKLLPMVAGLAVSQALEQQGMKPVWLKWPNDVVTRSPNGFVKLAGILCESRFSDGRFWAVCGIGLNLTQTREQLMQDGLEQAGSLQSVWGKAPDAEQVRQALDEQLFALLGNPEIGAEQILEQYSQVCITLGQEVLIEQNGQKIPATAQQVEPDGTLLCRTQTQTLRFHAGEVSVRGHRGYVD